VRTNLHQARFISCFSNWLQLCCSLTERSITSLNSEISERDEQIEMLSARVDELVETGEALKSTMENADDMIAEREKQHHDEIEELKEGLNKYIAFSPWSFLFFFIHTGSAWKRNIPCTKIDCSRPEVGKLRPVGRMPCSAGFSAALGNLQQIKKNLITCLFLLSTLSLCSVYLRAHRPIKKSAALWHFVAHWRGPFWKVCPLLR